MTNIGPMIDIHTHPYSSPFAIDSVGVTDLRYPFVALCPIAGETQRTTGRWRLSAQLGKSQRGSHMSRFVEAVHHRTAALPLGLDDFTAFVATLVPLLDTNAAQAEVAFSWFRGVAAPISKQPSLSEVEVTWSASAGASPVKKLGVAILAKALCPCSKAISDRGAHNQRAELTASLSLSMTAQAPSLVRIAELLESAASAPIYPLLKRPDEKFVTEQAYDHPRFVEDIARGAAARLADLPGVLAFSVEIVNRESIHAHDCFARITHTVGS